MLQPFLVSGDQFFLLSASSDPCQYEGNFLNLDHFAFSRLLTCIIVTLFYSAAEEQTAEELNGPRKRNLDHQGAHQMEVHQFLWMDCIT